MKKTLGSTIAALRKENAMTQSELADKMGVTDKAVSKWERDLSCPDISLLPKLAEIFHISVDELMQGKSNLIEAEDCKSISSIAEIAFKGVGLAMGIAVAVLSILQQIDPASSQTMLGIGLACLAIVALKAKEK